MAQLSFFAQPRLGEDLSLRGGLPLSSATVFTLMVDWCLFDLSIFFPYSLDVSRELRVCPGVGGRKCGAFLPSLDRDPHPTCARCRGKICARDMTCDFCVGWTPGQWELFAKRENLQGT